MSVSVWSSGRFWGPEPIHPDTWREFSSLLEIAPEQEWIREQLASCRTILDVGGGNGRMVEQLAAEGRSVTVLDRNESAGPSRSSRIRFVPGDACELPFDSCSFDGVVASWLLQYVREPAVAAAELVRVCAVARPATLIVLQAAPENDIVACYNACARHLGIPEADHDYLLRGAMETFLDAGFHLSSVHHPSPVRELASLNTLVRLVRDLNYHGHPRSEELSVVVEETLRKRRAGRSGPWQDNALGLLARRCVTRIAS